MLDQSIINLYDEYTHKPLSRKEFMVKLAKLAGSMSAAKLIASLLESSYTPKTVSYTDIFTERVTYEGVNGSIEAYIARPLESKTYPTVIVLHENRGLTQHIEDVVIRIAMAGYLSIAPNALSPVGKPRDEDDARKQFSELKQEDHEQNMLRVFDYLKTRKDCNGNLGCVGFCWGGAMANFLATKVPELRAAVSFYGKQANLDLVSNIKSAIQLHYAENDDRVNAGMSAYEDALKKYNIKYEQYIYPGVQHAFHNNTSLARYNKEAAILAWERTLAFFDKYLYRL